MTEQLGRSAWILALAAVAAAGFLALTGQRGGDQRPLVVWTFNRASVGPDGGYPATFEGRPVEVRLSPLRMMDVRAGARAMLPANIEGSSDLIETEITSAGKYFRGPADSAFFLPLASRVALSALDIVPSRLAAWRYLGEQLLVPRDVHPVALAYRADLFTAAGQDLGACRTWPELIAACRAYEAATGRAAIELPRSNASVVFLILQQRGVPLTDGEGRVHLTDVRIEETLTAYAGWVAGGGGAGPLGVAPARRMDLTAEDLDAGRLGALFAPDWKIGALRDVRPELAGKLRLRPLPIFSPGDAPTATWGGTGVGIPRDAPLADQAGRLLASMWRDRDALVRRYVATGDLPPVQSVWTDPRIAGPDAFFGGQPAGALLADLAREAPPTIASPRLPQLQLEMNAIVAGAVRTQAAGNVEATRTWIRAALNAAQARLEAR